MADPTDVVTRARAFAIAAHGEQRYGDQPYQVHLDAVAQLAAGYGTDAQVVAYLHDVVEDTSVPIESIRAEFGDRVARCVALVTDASGEDRAARKVATNAKLAKVEGDERLALIVKAADRLANLRASAVGGRHLAMYQAEHPAFEAAARRDGLCDPLWAEMAALLAAK